VSALERGRCRSVGHISAGWRCSTPFGGLRRVSVPLAGTASVVSADTGRAASRLSASCCSLPFAASVVPPLSPMLAPRTRTERLAERFTEPLDRPAPSPPSTRRGPSWPAHQARDFLKVCTESPITRHPPLPTRCQVAHDTRRMTRGSSFERAVLPWDCRVPLLRCAQLRPLHPSLRPRSDHGMVAAILVPPLWDLTTSTVCSATWVPSLLQPGTGHGVRWVSGEPVVTVRRRFGRGPHSHQRSTLRRFTPRRQPFPIAGVCSLPDRSSRNDCHRSLDEPA
jgi:hypothetical protein